MSILFPARLCQDDGALAANGILYIKQSNVDVITYTVDKDKMQDRQLSLVDGDSVASRGRDETGERPNKGS